MKEPLIHTQDLRYSYGNQEVLKGLNLEIPKGSIYGFLGPNGSGKTTTIRLLLGLLQPKKGSIHLFGQDLWQHRLPALQKVGALIEMPSLYRHLSGKDNLEVMRRQLGLEKSRIDHVLQVVRLSQEANRLVKHYSLGMCQRLGIALALLSDPELLILDEPTNGLDPSGIREMRELLKDLNQEHGKTIFLSSHLLSEIEKTVTHLSIIHQGKMAFEGAVQDLAHVASTATGVEVEVDNVFLAQEILQQNGYVTTVKEGHWVTIPVKDKHEVAALNHLLVGQGIAVSGLSYAQQNLEDLFLALTEKTPISVETTASPTLSLV
ncbi:ATP-binding cassette domain-containing protein [Nibribacter ruber]|uniref:ATP-binding cassette domain-containing protein n=1 Tax=Nibribacter ruber TaxID=2698458 RepID=A0A6P1NXX5_9BACT|nr:ABC transporter ATP-binding protein [Nibribacter ruber]QHL86541.1 ATP-binding cassette domain-containing protein [Nibribacter ruber]